MKRILLTFSFAALLFSTANAQVRLAAKYSYPLLPGSATDSVLYGLQDIRGCSFDTDVDGDAKSEILLTNYRLSGRAHVFEAVGNDSIALRWTSPALGAASSPSTNLSPRYAIFGDLDNDEKKEVITQASNHGIYIFEWDGVVGSDNYGTQPSQIIGTPFLSDITGNVEYMEVLDIDGDGQNELLVAYNSTVNAGDKYYIISAIGDWTTNDPGFSSFNVEYEGARTLIPSRYGLGGGNPIAMIAANFDGSGNKEILIHNWNLKNVSPMTVPTANTYQLADTTNNKENVFVSGGNDYVSLFGGLATDIDGDGRDEVYLPTWYGATTSTLSGYVDMIYYNTGSNTREIDSTTNIVGFNLTGVIGPPTGDLYNSNILGMGYGDIDGNGKKNLYFSGIYFGTSGFNIVTMEFQGGDKRNPANWTTSLLYRGDSTIYTSQTIRDSLGSRDTTYSPWWVQGSKIYARNTDFDRDGRQDILMPCQGWLGPPDSISVNRLVWNAGAGRYDTTRSKVANTKRWSFRILERAGSSGVEAKDLTVISPDDYKLNQNYPNPFNPSTTISFFLPIKDKISLKVYDVLGREVRTLINNEQRESGTGRIVWDGWDNAGKAAASGTYFYTLKFGNFDKTNKMLLLK